MIKPDLSLYLVTDRRFLKGRTLEDVVMRAIKGGVTAVQLREKDTPTEEFTELAKSLLSITRKYGIPLIINDRIDIALATGADGVHLGQSDLPYRTARKMLGYERIIGLSVENMDQLRDANELDVDYLGISPVFQTATKQDTAPSFGLEGLKEACRLSKHRCVAIGGINSGNAGEIMECGAEGLAVVSAIMDAFDPYLAALAFRNILNSFQK